MISLLAKLLFAVIWGAGENRVFREKGDALIQQHFKLYHVWMLLIFAVATYTADLLVWVWLMIYSILVLDVTWWVIRAVDFHRNTEAAVKFYGELNKWHLQTDWDNYLKLPLICGVYWWWWLFTLLLTVLGLIIIF